MVPEPLFDAVITKDVSTGQCEGVLQVVLADSALNGANGGVQSARRHNHVDPVCFQGLLDRRQHGGGRVGRHSGLVPVLHHDVSSDVEIVKDDPLFVGAIAVKCEIHVVNNSSCNRGSC